MEESNNPATLSTTTEGELQVVTGRKAARSLRLFLGDGCPFDPAIVDTLASEQPISSERIAELSTDSEGKNACPILEPVSSATYFPHTPLKNPSEAIFTTAEALGVSNDTPLQHLTADLEFERGKHGELTNIKKHLHDWNASSKNRHAKIPEAVSNRQEVPSTVALPANEIYPLTVELRPFKNKVGGHTAIFRFSKKAVCKALVNRENVWYEAVERRHLNLLKFMPKYIGVLNVRYSSVVREEEFTPKMGPVDMPFEATSEISVDILAVDQISNDLEKLRVFEPNNKPYSSSSNPYLRRPSFPGYQALRGDAFEEDPPPEVLFDDNRHIIPDLLWKHYSTSAPNATGQKSVRGNSLSSLELPEKDRDISIGSTSVNTDLQAQIFREVFVPQSRKLDDIFHMEEDFADPKESEASDSKDDMQNPILRKHTRFERFILLEDLTADMSKPCVLDLKMGTRQYGVEATDSKQASQRKKCSLTSSKKLGTRVCGLQVWNLATQKYFMKDKYFGRKLKSGLPFAKALAKFLYDGSNCYSIICKIPLIILLLQELFSYFQDLKGYRMYGSSILLMYDGALPLSQAKIKIHIIDFAQSVIGDDADYDNYKKPPKYWETADMGYLKGVRSLILYFKTIFEIFSGDSFDDIKDMDKYLERKSTTSCLSCQWVKNFADVETEINDVAEGDPFDVFAQDYDLAEVSD